MLSVLKWGQKDTFSQGYSNTSVCPSLRREVKNGHKVIIGLTVWDIISWFESSKFARKNKEE